MSAAKGKAYCDTIATFVSARIAAQFDLGIFAGMNELTLNNVFSVYPNPAKSALNIKLPVAIREVSFIDLMGKEVLVKSANTNELNISLDGVKPGMYFVSVKSLDGRSAVKRIVIE